MKSKNKGGVSDAYLSAIDAVEEAARNLEEVSERFEEANQTLMNTASEKRKADEALRAALAALRRTQKE